jgi:acyl transferase domain-containing protein
MASQAVEMLRRRVFLPTAGVNKPRSDFDWAGHNMAVQQSVEPFPTHKKVIVAVSSFGIGGSYAHCLVREWRVSRRSIENRATYYRSFSWCETRGEHTFVQ